MVNVCEVPGQPFADVDTVIVAITGNTVLLTVIKDAISPEPLAANPIDGLSLVHE